MYVQNKDGLCCFIQETVACTGKWAFLKIHVCVDRFVSSVVLCYFIRTKFQFFQLYPNDNTVLGTHRFTVGASIPCFFSVNDQILFKSPKKLIQFGYNAFCSHEQISDNEKMTDAFKLFRTNGRNVSAKRKAQHCPICKWCPSLHAKCKIAV